MNALTNVNPRNPPCLPLSENGKLNALLASGESRVVGPRTAAELRAILDAWPDYALPTPDRVENMIGMIAIATKERQLSKDENRARLELYWRVLRDIPVVDLVAGFDDLVASRTFMPTPAEVLTACRAYTAKREYCRSRARHLLWLHDTQWRPPLTEADMVKPEDVAGLKAQAASSLSTPVTRERDDMDDSFTTPGNQGESQ